MDARRARRPIVVNARVTEEGAAQIDAIAEAEDRSRSDVVRILLKEALDARARAGKLPKR